MTGHTHVYFAQKDCGCYVGGHVDDGSTTLKEWVGGWVMEGWKVVRVTIEEARTEAFSLGCRHVAAQRELFRETSQ